jgi:GntR family transcriptional regulator, arabinose operon transcriptional repressor
MSESDFSPLLYERIKDYLKSDMASDKLTPGAKIPSERELAVSQNVSRITVKRAIADLIQEGYLEHLAGRKGAFVRRRTGGVGPRIIAVAIDDVRDAFGSQILRGIEDFFWDRHIHTLICNADRDFTKAEEYFRSFPEIGVSGVVFAPIIDKGYKEKNRKLALLLAAAHIPFTLIDRYIPGLLTNYAVANHEESSRILTMKLLELGHRRILVGRGMECSSIDDRIEGYRNAHQDAGTPVDERLIIEMNDNLLNKKLDEAELERIKARIRKAGAFSCFYALNDRILAAGAAALSSLGYKVGRDVLVVAHSEIDSGAFPVMPDVPRFVEPSYEMGWEAAGILLDHINDPSGAIVQKVLKSRLAAAPSSGMGGF